ncbi:MAG: CBS domain-containing protein [Acidimicrobiia bacterium]
MKLRNLMSSNVLTISPDAPLKQAARLMMDAGVSGLPVVTSDGTLVGIITEADFVATEADRRKKERARLLRFLDRGDEIPSQERLVGDVMTPHVHTLGPDTDHADAARLMKAERVKRVPVTEGGKLIGLVSRTDMLKAFARPDDEIAEEIRDHVMHEILWVNPNRVQVVVKDGNVVLTGLLETKSDCTLLIALTRRLDGVVSVKDQLTFEIDNTKLEMVSRPAGFPAPKA